MNRINSDHICGDFNQQVFKIYSPKQRVFELQSSHFRMIELRKWCFLNISGTLMTSIFGKSTTQNKTLSNQNKGYLGSR